MPDTAYGAPQAGTSGGVGGFFADHPWAKWVALAGVAGGAYVLYRRHQANASAAVAGTDTTGVSTAPGYGGSGLPYGYGGTNMGQLGSPSTNISDWVTSAMSFLTAQGVDPVAAENALAAWIAGQPLTTAQQNIISKALQGIGQAPGGPYPIVPVVTPPAPPAQGKFWDPLTWVWNNLAPATVSGGIGLLHNMGLIGQKGGTLTPPPGSAIYARLRNKAGQFQWFRVTSFAQYATLQPGTQLAYLGG